MIKAIIGIAGALCVLAGLASSAIAVEAVHYACADKTQLSATFHASPAAADIVFDGSEEKVTLPQALSADGGRYAAGDIEFWIKGREATLSRGRSKTSCKS
jgi:membrane-bound inhibitor of C-type lysozyme